MSQSHPPSCRIVCMSIFSIMSHLRAGPVPYLSLSSRPLVQCWAHSCVGQCSPALRSHSSPLFCGKERERRARKEESLRIKAAGKFSGPRVNWERALSPRGCRAISIQIVTTREHSAPRKRVCLALALAQPLLSPHSTSPGNIPVSSRDLDEAQPCLRHFAILGLIKTPQTV